jgi:4-amino-4-deoxy-L-arabinose transferase-like glycosyltransferase
LNEVRTLNPKVEIILFGLILVLAAWLRFQHIDHAEFLWDQAEISKWALRVGQEKQMTWVGPPSSTGLYTFPAAIWLLAIPYALSLSPVFASGFVAAINLAAVAGCYALTRRWFGRAAALVATLLFAVAPWAVIYSRKVWHTTLLPPFVLLHVATGWLAFVRGRRWALPAHVLALALLIQLHFSTLPFALLTILWALLFRRCFDWRLVPVSIALTSVTFIPYLIFDAQHDWVSVRQFTEIMELPTRTSLGALEATWDVTSGQNLQRLTGPDYYAQFVADTPNMRWLFPILGGMTVGGIGVALWRALRQARTGLNEDTAAALMTVSWLLMPALFLTRGKIGAAQHYFTTTFPAQFILIGYLFTQAEGLPGRSGPIVQGVLGVSVLVLGITQAYEVTRALEFVWAHDTTWGYGTPLHYELEAAETAARLSQAVDGQEIIVLAAGDEPRRFEMAGVSGILLYDQPHRPIDVRSAMVFPEHPAVYWMTHQRTHGEALLSNFAPERTEARIPLREGKRSFRFYTWPGGAPDIACLQPVPEATWTNGAQLIGYCLEGTLQPGGKIRWTLVWRPVQTPQEDVYYHWFNHLLDETGQMIVQQDGPSVIPISWREGDTMLNWFDFQIPSDVSPEAYFMRLGMYTYPVIENVPLSDGEEWINLGPLSVQE